MATTLSFLITSVWDGAGTSGASRDIGTLKQDLDGANTKLGEASGKFFSLGTAAAALGPAIVPIGTAVTGVGAATVAMGASAGAALGVYGLAMKSAINSADELAKKGDTNAQHFVKSSNDMTTAWDKLVASTTKDTLGPASTAIEGITIAIGKLKPILDAMGPVVQKVADDFKKWASDGGMDRFVDTIVKYGVPALKNMLDAGEKMMSVLGSAFRTLAPEGLKLSEAIDKGATALKKWSDDGGFTRFLDKVKQDAPHVKDFFEDFGKATANVAEAMAGLGPLALGVADALLKIIAACPPGVIQAIVLAFEAWRLAMLGMAIVNVVATGMSALAAAAAAAGVSMWAVAWPILLIIGIIAALAFGIYELVQHWDGFSHAMVTAWNAVWNAVKIAGTAVWNALKTAWSATVSALSTAWSAVSGALTSAWNTVWNALKTAAQAVWNALKTAWSAFVQGLSTAWNAVSNALRTAWTTVWNALKTAADTVWNAIKTAWNAFINALSTAWNAVSNALKTAWNAVWNALKTAAQTVWNAIKTAWQTFIQALSTAWTTVSNALKTAWQTVWNALKTAAQTVWNAMKTAWTTFLNALKTAWTTVSNALKTAWQTVWNALKTAAQAVWDAMKTAWNTFVNALKTVWDTVSSALKTAWQAVWDWIKTTAQTIWDGIKQAWETFTNWINDTWKKAGELLKQAWHTAMQWLHDDAVKVWDAIKSVIQAAVDFIKGIINGLIGVWNSVAGAIGLPTIGGGGGGGGGGGSGPGAAGGSFGSGGDNLGVGASSGTGPGGVPGFAQGGVLDGYEPGIDSQLVAVSKGEGILVPEAVQGLGADFVHGANHHFSGGRAGSPSPGFSGGGIQGYSLGGLVRGIPGYAQGGIIPPIPGGGVIGGLIDTITGNTGLPGKIAGALGIPDIGAITAQFMEWINKAAGMSGFLNLNSMGGKAADLGKQMLEKVVQKIQEMMAALAAKAASAAGGALSGAVGNLKDLALKALLQAGIPASQLANFLKRIQIESSGNPNAINNWDINAKNGIPSQGLGQIIPPNFAKYHAAGTSYNILDPTANLYASANYIKGVYGGVVPTGAAYANGTPFASQGWHLVGENGPEMRWFNGGESVADGSTTRAAMRAGGGGGDTHHHYWDLRGATKEAIQELQKPATLDKLRQAMVAGTGKRRYGP